MKPFSELLSSAGRQAETITTAPVSAIIAELMLFMIKSFFDRFTGVQDIRNTGNHSGRRSPRMALPVLAVALIVLFTRNSQLSDAGATEERATTEVVVIVAITSVVLLVLSGGALGLVYLKSVTFLPDAADERSKQLYDEGKRLELSRAFDEAAENYEAALRIEPAFVRCMTAAGILHCRRGAPTDGKRMFETAAQCCPKSAYVLHLLSKVERKLGLADDANRHAEQAKSNLEFERSQEPGFRHTTTTNDTNAGDV